MSTTNPTISTFKQNGHDLIRVGDSFLSTMNFSSETASLIQVVYTAAVSIYKEQKERFQLIEKNLNPLKVSAESLETMDTINQIYATNLSYLLEQMEKISLNQNNFFERAGLFPSFQHEISVLQTHLEKLSRLVVQDNHLEVGDKIIIKGFIFENQTDILKQLHYSNVVNLSFESYSFSITKKLNSLPQLKEGAFQFLVEHKVTIQVSISSNSNSTQACITMGEGTSMEGLDSAFQKCVASMPGQI